MKVKKIAGTDEQIPNGINKTYSEADNTKIISTETPRTASKNKYYLIGSGLLIIIAVLVFFLLSQNNNSNDRNNDDKNKSVLNNTNQKEKQSPPSEQKYERKNEFNLSGSYWGSIKDGTRWYQFITNFDGKNFSGYNQIYWKKYPDGYKTNFNGEYHSDTRQIIIYEDRNTKGAGKFIGTVSDDGRKMSGDWYRYSDNGSFTWNLEKSD